MKSGKGFLNRVQLSVLAETLIRQNLAVMRLYGKHCARLHCHAIQQDRAGPAVAGIAPDMCSSEIQRFAQQLNQQQPWLDLTIVGFPVDGYMYSDALSYGRHIRESPLP